MSTSRPLTLPELHLVRQMLRSKVRHTEIAKALDLAVGTVSRIASDRNLRDPEVADELLDLPEDDPPPGYEAKNLRRCPTCGAMVYLWPCLACHMKAQARPLPNSFNPEPEATEEEVRNAVATLPIGRAKLLLSRALPPTTGSAGASPSQPSTQVVRS